MSFFIDRPKFALVISIFLTILGGIAYLVLPVEQFPFTLFASGEYAKMLEEQWREP